MSITYSGIKRKSTFRNVSIISVLSALGMIAGVGMLMLLASLAGVTTQADAFFIAYLIPSFLNVALYNSTFIFVSAFTKAYTTQKTHDANNFINTIVSMVILIMGVLFMLTWLLAPLIVRLLAPGVDDQTKTTSVQLLRILAWIPVFVGLGNVGGTILNSKNHFSVAAAGQLVRYSGALIGGILFPQGGAYSIATGLVIGSAIQVVWIIWACKQQAGYTFKFNLNCRLPGVIEIGKMSWSVLVGMLIWQGTPVSDRLFASYLLPGSIATIQYASQFVGPVSGIFFSSIIAATMPEISSKMAAGKEDEVNQLLLSNRRLISSISLPLVAMILSLNQPLMSLYLQRGAFDQSAIIRVIPLAMVYTVSLLFFGYITLQSAFCSATNNHKGLVRLFSLVTGLDVLIKGILYPFIGLMASAISYVISMAITAVYSLFYIGRNRRIQTAELFSVDIKILITAIVMGVVSYGSTLLVNLLIPNKGQTGNLIKLMVGGVLGMSVLVVYIVASRVRKKRVKN